MQIMPAILKHNGRHNYLIEKEKKASRICVRVKLFQLTLSTYSPRDRNNNNNNNDDDNLG